MTTEIVDVSGRYPWTEFDRAFEEMRSRFNDWFRGFADFPEVSGDGSKAPLRLARADIAETPNAYKIIAEVPGIPKDRVDIRIRGSTVEIRGDVEESKESREGEYLHQERSRTGFFRRFELPENVKAAEAKAHVKDGLLELELPKETPAPAADEVRVAIE